MHGPLCWGKKLSVVSISAKCKKIFMDFAVELAQTLNALKPTTSCFITQSHSLNVQPAFSSVSSSSSSSYITAVLQPVLQNAPHALDTAVSRYKISTGWFLLRPGSPGSTHLRSRSFSSHQLLLFCRLF